MQYFIVILLIAYAKSEIVDSGCVTIRNNNYEKQVLKSGVRSPYQLVVDYDTNTLFFSYTARTDETFKIAYLSLKTNDYGIVSGIRGGFANAVDSRGNHVYMGGEDGLYQFNYNTKSATKLNINGHYNVWQMFYRNMLYFSVYPSEKAYLYKNGRVEEVDALRGHRAMLIAELKNGNLAYSNSSGLYKYDNILRKSKNIGDQVVNGFSVDMNDRLYFSTPTGIYYMNEEASEIELLVTLDNVYGMAIDGSGNIIYAADDDIVRLIPTKKDCFVLHSVNRVV